MHTFLFVLPALHALVLFMVAVLLIKTIVALKSKPVFRHIKAGRSRDRLIPDIEYRD